jgi:signal transduction histidine kinase
LQQEPRPPTGQQVQQTAFVFALADNKGMVVVPGGPYKIRERIPEEVLSEGEPVLVNGETVGTVIAFGEPPQLAPREEHYLERTNQTLLYAAGGAALVALILGIFLARGLTGPLRELTGAIRLMAQGQLGQQVTVHSGDEIGELAAAFNQMSAELENLTAQRQQMTADIAHDLRTPLTVIGGYVESMQDGVLKATPERLETIYKEVEHLQRLVEDLRTLSLAEAGQLSLNPVLIAPQVLLGQVEAAYRLAAEQKGVEFVLTDAQNIPEIMIDPDRMMQVLNNLVGNALRHTPAGGKIRIQCSVSNKPSAVSRQPSAVSRQLLTDSCLLITVTDTGEGIAPEVLPRIFDRFYRGDQARQEGEGESGLGLAIAKSIVEMHGGELGAQSKGLGKGSTFTIHLPIENRTGII